MHRRRPRRPRAGESFAESNDAGGQRLYRNPDEPDGPALLWIVAEAVVEFSDEDGLCDALEALPNQPELLGAPFA